MTVAYPFPFLKDEFKDKRVLVTGGTKGMERRWCAALRWVELPLRPQHAPHCMLISSLHCLYRLILELRKEFRTSLTAFFRNGAAWMFW